MRVTVPMARFRVPALVMVIVCGADVLPICTLPKARDSGDAEIIGFSRVTVFVVIFPELS